MTDTLDAERSILIGRVEDGPELPSVIEHRAKIFGLAPFSTGPCHTALDPMSMDRWSLPMAAAWFIWRSSDAVLHQMPEARSGWKIWERYSNNKQPAPIKDEIQLFKKQSERERYRLIDIGAPRLCRVFYESRWEPSLSRVDDLPKDRPSMYWNNNILDRPFSRFVSALETGKMIANKLVPYTTAVVPERPGYWAMVFHAAPTHDAEFYLFPGEEEYFVSRQQAIEVEREIAKSELDPPIVGLEQALGWIAYQDTDAFRSLGRDDIRGKPYYNQLYGRDFVSLHPDRELYNRLIEGKLAAYRKGQSLTLSERMELTSVWDASDVKFFRKDLIEIWPDQSARVRDEGSPSPCLATGKSADATKEPVCAQPTIADEDVSFSERPRTAAPSSKEAHGRQGRLARKTGPRPVKFEAVKGAILKAIEDDPTAAERLKKMTEKEIQREFGGLSRHLAQKARDVLSQFVGVRNSDK